MHIWRTLSPLGARQYSKPVFNLTKVKVEQVRRWALAGEIEALKNFLSACHIAMKNYKHPEVKHSGETWCRFILTWRVFEASSYHSYHGNFREHMQDNQVDDLFTIGGNEENLQPLIEEVGQTYMIVE